MKHIVERPELAAIAQQATSSELRLERILWGRLLRRAITDPESLFTRNLAKYGPRGAGLFFMERCWGLASGLFVWLAVAFALVGFSSHGILAGVSAIVWALCFVMTIFRGWSSWRAKREWVRAQR